MEDELKVKMDKTYYLDNEEIKIEMFTQFVVGSRELSNCESLMLDLTINRTVALYWKNY